MSQTVSDETRVEIVVEYRGRQPRVVHRPDFNGDEPRPACSESVAHTDEYRKVSLGAVSSHRELCQNPECFGQVDPARTQICVSGISGRPIRMQAFQVVVTAAVFQKTPLSRSDIREFLGVSSSKRGSLRRGVRDARDAGWVEYSYSDYQYYSAFAPDRSPLTHICVSGLPDIPTRNLSFQLGVIQAILGEDPITRSHIQDLLGVDDSKRDSLRRGLLDARDAGWLEGEDYAKHLRPGPLAKEVSGGDWR